MLLRSESLAANLGAKLTGPLLLKSFDKLFDGPITILQAPYGTDASAVTWLDIVEFARSKPQEFVLNADRVCQIWIKQCRIQILEDDYRLVLSGAPERMIPSLPIADDEISEMGTIEILEQRLALLIKKADLVAGRARQLNYHLKGRKAAINGRRSASQLPEPAGGSQVVSSFQPINHLPSTNGEARGLHVELLRQFMADDRKHGATSLARVKPMRTAPGSPHNQGYRHQSPHDSARRQSHSHGSSNDDGTGGPYRTIMTAKVEKLNRGEAIWPPCDRCRRLGIECTKHLTACSGCTKKHARCGWKEVVAEEAAYLNQMPESTAALTNVADGANGYMQAQSSVLRRSEGSVDQVPRDFIGRRSNGSPTDEVPSRDISDGDLHAKALRKDEEESISDENMLSQIASAAAAAASNP